MNFWESMEPKCKLKHIPFFFTYYWYTKALKTPEKLYGSKISPSSLSEFTTGFINYKTWRSFSGVSRSFAR